MMTLISALLGAATGFTAAASAPIAPAGPVEARIPFAGDVRDFRPDGNDAILIEDDRRQWYRGVFFGPCLDLPFADAIGFGDRGTGGIDRYATIYVRGITLPVDIIGRGDGGGRGVAALTASRSRSPLSALVGAAMLLIGAAPPPIPSDTPAVARSHRIARPRTNSTEVRLSWGAAAINALRVWRRGVDGSGVTVAMIDTGLGNVTPDMFGRVSDASVDLVRDRRDLSAPDHGEQTAGVLAAAADGVGTVGVAYGATLLVIRADLDGSCPARCAVRTTDLARGIDYALEHGARIIGVPLVGRHRLPAIEPALARAVKAGAVIVAAAGNDASALPDWPARYAADPRFAPGLIVAAASTVGGRIARWSNRSGGVAGHYLAAPGENIIVDCGARTCRLVSGTSYAVPYIAGALSLLIAAHPALSAQDAARLLLASATNNEILDVARALRVADAAPRKPA